MYSFRNDYSEGAHPQVLQALADTNLEQTCGYGLDHHCQEAADLIRSQCMAPEADVHFLVGGTQANLVTITSFLASYEAVIAAHTGHVNTHETGAIEATLTAPGNDLKLPDLAALTDMFYIGGTKNGALFGEALVVTTPNAHFRWHMKQRGAILAKGRLLGVQFKALLKDGLYFDMARHANEMAQRLQSGIAALGYPFPVASPTNQQFPVLPNTVARQLEALGYAFEAQEPVDDAHTVVRFVTSWATPAEAVDQFLKDLAACQ